MQILLMLLMLSVFVTEHTVIECAEELQCINAGTGK